MANEIAPKVRALLALKRSEAMADLKDTYGKPGAAGWSLTEVLRLDRRLRARMLDLLTGTHRGKVGTVAPYAGTFRLRTTSGEPFEVVRVRPDPDTEPSVVEGDFDGLPRVEHHTARDWTPQVFPMEADASMLLTNQHDVAHDATWMLMHWGHSAREGGSEKRRWGNKKSAQEARTQKREPGPEALDRWQVYEVAFSVRQPKLCPLTKPTAERQRAAA